MLADMGADVIKVETPGIGDPLRAQGAIKDGLSWYFAGFNRNKRSLSLNLRSEAGRAVLSRLIAGSDVLVENFRPGVLAQMGFDKTRLRQLKPDLAANYFATGEETARTGNDHAIVAPYGMFRTRDGEVALAPSQEQSYQRLLDALGLAELRADPRFATNDLRVKNRVAINAAIEAR